VSSKTLHCGELIKRINDIIEKKANNNLNKEDITVSQFKMLIRLNETSDGSFTLKELEKYFGVAQSTIAGIASRLEKKQLVYGYTDSADRRIKHIKITDAGRAMCINARISMEENERHLLSVLTEDEQHRLHELLYKIYNAIR